MDHHNLLALDLGNIKGPGQIANFTYDPANPYSASFQLTKIISLAIGVMTLVALIWFLFTLMIAAITWLGSASDKARLQDAQKRIAHSLTGLILIISAIFITKVIGYIFGIDILDLTTMISGLWK